MPVPRRSVRATAGAPFAPAWSPGCSARAAHLTSYRPCVDGNHPISSPSTVELRRHSMSVGTRPPSALAASSAAIRLQRHRMPQRLPPLVRLPALSLMLRLRFWRLAHNLRVFVCLLLRGVAPVRSSSFSDACDPCMLAMSMEGVVGREPTSPLPHEAFHTRRVPLCC
eukprot:1931271-Pleurochrysis_carterae.AAC.1